MSIYLILFFSQHKKNASSEDTASVVFNGDTISCGSLSVPVLQMRANYPVSDSQRSFYMEYVSENYS